MSGRFLYCPNPDCGTYLGSLGANHCRHCGWCFCDDEPQEEEEDDN